MPPSRKAAPDGCSVEAVGKIFQQIHKSAAHAHRGKAALLTFAESDCRALIDAVVRVALLVLKESPKLAPDSLKRHHSFLADLCRGFRDRCGGSDALAVSLLESVEPFHNAADRAVRLSVVSLFDALLRTADQSNTTEERQAFYQRAADLLKLRAHDRHPSVRERAVSAAACFQTGRRDCDVTQQLLALLCTDTAADVRRQILRCVAARKEFLEGYFHGMTRSVRDGVARVRAEAWDALGRFHWKYIAAYAVAKGVAMQELILSGLSDTNASVSIACRAALTNCWLHRDYADDCAALLDPLVANGAAAAGPLGPFDALCREMLLYLRARQRRRRRYALALDGVSATALMLWRASARLAADDDALGAGGAVGDGNDGNNDNNNNHHDDDDDDDVLLPLAQFGALLQDTVYAYARPDVAPKTVTFRSVDEADVMLRVLLSAFEVYEENGYLAHADNTTRGELLRVLGFLLKVVPDDDPALFVDVAVRSLRALTERTPEETTKAITAALDSLFRSLRLPQKYALGYDDVEAFARKSRDRQRELQRRRVLLRSGEATQADYDELHDEMDRDEKFLLRMQFIVLAFLSHAQRGEDIPPFCSHVIQLGRQQDGEAVRVVSTTSLGMQCLVSPDAVHTFLPLLLADANGPAASTAERCVPRAALAVIFDLVMEYGLRFFDAPQQQQQQQQQQRGGDELPLPLPLVSDAAMDARLQHERALAQDSGHHRVGGANVLHALRVFLRGDCAVRRPMAVVGFCKLLSCNRVPHAQVPEVVADLLLHHVAYRSEPRTAATAAYMSEYIGRFLHSFAASHPQRQEAFARGGVAALRALLPHSTAAAQRLAECVARLSDASVLTHVRDIDPAQQRHAATRSSAQSGRLARELSRFSLHEYLASELLVEMAANDAPDAQDVCMDVLERRMYFYAKEPPAWLLRCAARAVGAAGGKLRTRLEAWRAGVAARGAAPQTEAEGEGEAEAVGDEGRAQEEDTQWREALEARDRGLERVMEGSFAQSLCQALRAGGSAIGGETTLKAVKEETKHPRDAEGTAVDIDSILGCRKRARR